MKKLLHLVILLLLMGCVGKVEHEKVLKQNQTLKTQIEQLTNELNGYKNDPAKLLQQAQDGLKNEDENALISACANLKLYHPERNERKQADDLYSQYLTIKEKNNFWIDHLFLTFICRQREKNKDAWLVNRCLSCNCHLYIPK